MNRSDTDMNDPPIATRTMWKTHPCPDERAALSLTDTHTPAEFARITAGFIPQEMDDKWFVFFEAPWLYFHRSWTGFCIYGVRLESSSKGATVVESWVSRNNDQYRKAQTDYEQQLLKRLIDGLLLGRAVPLPKPRRV